MEIVSISRKGKVDALCRQSEKFEKAGEIFRAIVKLETAQKWLRASKDYDRFETISLKINELSNLLAMNYLQRNDPAVCLEFLRRAEKTCLNSISHKSVTLNNLACYYRSQKQYRVSLKFLFLAYDCLSETKDRGLADLLLNMCAVQSKLGKHNEAYLSAVNAVSILQNELLALSMPFLVSAIGQEPKSTTSSQQLSSQELKSRSSHNLNSLSPFEKQKSGSINLRGLKKRNSVNSVTSSQPKEPALPDRKISVPESSAPTQIDDKEREKLGSKLTEIIVVYSIALHNQAVELEYLERYKESLQFYEKSYLTALNHLGAKSSITVDLGRVYELARDKIDKIIEKTKIEREKKRRSASKKFKLASKRRDSIEIYPEDEESGQNEKRIDLKNGTFTQPASIDSSRRANDENSNRFDIESSYRFAQKKSEKESQKSSVLMRPLEPNSLFNISSNSRMNLTRRRHTYNIKPSTLKSIMSNIPDQFQDSGKFLDGPKRSSIARLKLYENSYYKGSLSNSELMERKSLRIKEDELFNEDVKHLQVFRPKRDTFDNFLATQNQQTEQVGVENPKKPTTENFEDGNGRWENFLLQE